MPCKMHVYLFVAYESRAIKWALGSEDTKRRVINSVITQHTGNHVQDLDPNPKPLVGVP